jgi:uncharacterized protein (DUF3084 family)
MNEFKFQIETLNKTIELETNEHHNLLQKYNSIIIQLNCINGNLLNCCHKETINRLSAEKNQLTFERDQIINRCALIKQSLIDYKKSINKLKLKEIMFNQQKEIIDLLKYQKNLSNTQSNQIREQADQIKIQSEKIKQKDDEINQRDKIIEARTNLNRRLVDTLILYQNKHDAVLYDYDDIKKRNYLLNNDFKKISKFLKSAI